MVLTRGYKCLDVAVLLPSLFTNARLNRPSDLPRLSDAMKEEYIADIALTGFELRCSRSVAKRATADQNQTSTLLSECVICDDDTSLLTFIS